MIVLFLVFTVTGGTFTEAEAARKTAVKKAPSYNPKYAGFVVDGDTGKILYQDHADALRHPASLTKMMTLYLTFEALNNGHLRLDQKLNVSQEATKRPQTNLSMQPGDKITVREAIIALVVRSANDVAVVLAEALGGTEAKFAQIMTQRSRELGMKNTTFRNASGLHDPKQITTAKDMALLAIALKKHYPEYFHFFSRTQFTFNGVNYTSHNRVMQRYPGADGLKTGFINASGFNLVTTASRRGYNLVGVVIGGRSGATRDEHMIKILDEGFVKIAKLRGGFQAEYPKSGRQRQNFAGAEPGFGAANAGTLSDPIVAAATGNLQAANDNAIVETASGISPSSLQGSGRQFANGFVPTPQAKPRAVSRR